MNEPLQIPLFPLGTVLFPGGSLPLQIFEVRYLDMVRRCHRHGTPFGVVCLTQGREVQRPGAGDGSYEPEGFHAVGTLARIVELAQAQPGLLFIACEGQARFRILHSERQPNGLWVARVEPLLPDAAAPIPAELGGIGQALKQLHDRLQTEQPGAVAPYPPYRPDQGPWQDAGWVANRWAELMPLPLSVKQQLLTLDSPLLRLELIGDALDQFGIPH